MRAFVSWSGGKDCTLALHHFLSDPQNEVSFLLNMSHDTGSISKFHDFGSDILFEQSNSLGIPLLIERVSSKGYAYHLKKIMKKFKEDGVGYGVFGDIFLEEHRDWITEVCGEVGITPIFPLWGREPLSVVKEFCELGYKAKVTSVKEGGDYDHLLNKEININFIKEICSIKGADPCGENGEYHTLVFDGPIFKKKHSKNFYQSLLLICLILTIFFPKALSCETKFKKIISLTPSITQSIYYLDAQDRLIGCTNYCHLAISDDIEIVSSAIKPNLEKIAKLKPDIVLASGMISERDVNTLRRLGIKVEIFPTPRSFIEICNQFTLLGDLIDKQKRAEEIVKESAERVNRIRDEMKKRGNSPRFFIQIGASPIFTVIPGTFMNDYIIYSNGENIASALSSGTIGREFVVARDPDYIFIVTMGITGEHEERRWREFINMKAVNNNRIFILESEKACQPTPVTFAETLEIIYNKLLKK